MTGARNFYSFVCALIVVACSQASFALSCETKPMELAFDHASHVFLARIVSTEILSKTGAPSDSRAARIRHRFELVEPFKGDVSYSTFETGFAWLSDRPHFSVGDVNLFFMDETRSFDSCTPKYLLEQQDTAMVLRKLRDLKKGVFDTISGAWTTTVSSDHCSIYATYLLDGSSSTVSFSIGHTVASEEKAAYSNVWVYSYSNSGKETIDRSGVRLSYDQSTVTIPYANSLLDNGANFYSKIRRADLLLGAVLAEEPVFLEASTRNDIEIEIPLLLNGGSEAIKEFAHCGKLQLGHEQ